MKVKIKIFGIQKLIDKMGGKEEAEFRKDYSTGKH